MASVARRLHDTLFLLNIVIFNLKADARYPPVNPKQIEISDHWEKDGVSYQDKKIDELVVKRGVDNLRLLCKVHPPLPKTEEHYALRNHLIRFEKVYPEHYVLTGLRFWTDDLQHTAIALDVRNVELFGTYACVYGEMRKYVDILADNKELIKSLPPPATLEHMISSTFIKKYSIENIQPNDTVHVVERPEFNCKVKKSETVAKSVHTLTPKDISVVASLGDSLMIGLGASATTTPAHFFTEFRGISWSNGGDASIEEVLTLPNLLKRFNPNLKGYSTKTDRHYQKNSGLNLATVFATSRHLKAQAQQLISQVKKDKKIDFNKDWKLVNIMSGSRDLCRLCGNMDEITPDVYIESLVKTLDTLQRKMPKTFVNLILPLNVSSLFSLNVPGQCKIGNWSVCPCLEDKFTRKRISNFYAGYKSLVYELIDSGVYDGRDDFSVAIQPVFEDLSLDASENRDLFSLDCLHFSAKGNAMAAVALWNNMFEPISKKYSRWQRQQNIQCPAEDSPYFSTKMNSISESKHDRSQDSKHEISPGIIVAVTMAIIFALTLFTAFVYLKHRLRTPITRLKFSNKPWLKYSI